MFYWHKFEQHRNDWLKKDLLLSIYRVVFFACFIFSPSQLTELSTPSPVIAFVALIHHCTFSGKRFSKSKMSAQSTAEADSDRSILFAMNSTVKLLLIACCCCWKPEEVFLCFEIFSRRIDSSSRATASRSLSEASRTKIIASTCEWKNSGK